MTNPDKALITFTQIGTKRKWSKEVNGCLTSDGDLVNITNYDIQIIRFVDDTKIVLIDNKDNVWRYEYPAGVILQVKINSILLIYI